MTGGELAAWIAENHADGLPVVCEQVNDEYSGNGVVGAEIRRVWKCGGLCRPMEDGWPWDGIPEDADVIWLRCE